MRTIICLFSLLLLIGGCKKDNPPDPVVPPAAFSFNSLTVNGTFDGYVYENVNATPVIRVTFTAAIDRASVGNAVTLNDKGGTDVLISITYENSDSAMVIRPQSDLVYLSRYTLFISNALKSKTGGSLLSSVTVNLTTSIDPADKFPRVSDDSLLTIVQEKTFRYFWEFGHPVSGMARERNSSGDLVTSGGTGFGIMSIPVAVERKFISRAEGLDRMLTITDFLLNKAQRFHGAWSHWLSGTSGVTILFSTNDNGGDLVETAYLVQGLLTARQYFNSATDPDEILLRATIDTLWHGVEWDWYRRGNQNALYWHWSPTVGWAMNMKVQGWNEALIVYILAASSPTHTIPKQVYETGWALNGAIRLNQSYYGYNLPLGQPLGGPLFFAHYSFLGVDPRNLSDQYANYWEQNVNHSKINYSYCVANPNGYSGYGPECWGLTASDIPGGYTASSPTNDRGVITPTAAISSLPYTPTESMQALKFFYYKLGDKIFKDFGFVDAFSLEEIWFADSFLAIDQGPEICMIENYRSGLLWGLFMSCPEVQEGLTKLGFSF